MKVVAVNGTCKVKEINSVIESHSIVTQNISITLLKEEQNKTTIIYKLRTPFRKLDLDKVIEDINEIDGIYSVEKEVDGGRESFLTILSNRWMSSKKGNKKSSM